MVKIRLKNKIKIKINKAIDLRMQIFNIIEMNIILLKILLIIILLNYT